MTAALDRRTWPRLTPRQTIFVEYPRHLARVRDLSLSGAFVEDTRPLEVGRWVHFKLWVDPTKPALEATAAIRRRTEGEGMGVEFIGMNYLDHARLREALTTVLA